jgi:iron-sulfur cluster repair protein YtfE (RIC family)
MGGSQLWKVLWDYHKKIDNMMNRYDKGDFTLLNPILTELEIYGAIEEEILYPALAEVNPSVTEQAQQSQDEIKDIVTDLQSLEPDDPLEPKLMKRLTRRFQIHTEREEQRIFPIIKSQFANEQYDMARQAFALRQEMVGTRGGVPINEQYFIGLPNSGWTKSKVVGGGW